MTPLRVFVSFGTHEQQFNRLMSWCTRAARHTGGTWIVQSGFTDVPDAHPFDKVEPLIGHTDFLNELRLADVMVTQASPGNVYAALESGCWPLVVPRSHKLGEHVDDHQQHYAQQLKTRKLAHPIESEDALDEALRLLGHQNKNSRLMHIQSLLEDSHKKTEDFVGKLRTVLRDLDR